MELRRTEWL